ncbi:hypothetical protein [Frankia sp. CiP3]|uniref:hypothetical protein n=1 Tax=Frankia sp. CiP3 TaxID=2880971 RepID=UPI001EF5DC61|nr:hypothetical protein [Frankia sp. CiP3]
MSIRESDGSPAGLEYVARFPSADLIIVGCGAAGMAAAVGTLLPWAGATLSDRGAVLLAVSRTGLELSANGAVVLLLGVVCAVSCLLPPDGRRARPLSLALASAGLVITVLAAAEIDAGDPLAAKLLQLRIGTFQTDHPVASTHVGLGLWLSLAAGVTLSVGGAGWQLVGRFTRVVGDPA